jgi:hypothetical protein
VQGRLGSLAARIGGVPDPGCLTARLEAWWPLLGAAVVLLLLRVVVFLPRMQRVGSPVPWMPSIESLLRHGRYRGVMVGPEPPGPFGGGRYVPWLRARGEIRLDESLLGRRDVDALAILEHERGHAERDLPAPRLYRMLLVATFLAGLALALGNPMLAPAGTTLMWAAFVVAGLHFLRNEAAATEYALRELWTHGWPRALWREAIGRLGASLGAYVAEAAVAAALIALVGSALLCR